MLNQNEKHIVKIIIAFVALVGILFSLVDFFASGNYALYWKIAVLVFSLLIIWFGKELVFHKMISLIPSMDPGRSITNGSWNLKITFKDEGSDDLKERTGTVSFLNSLVGVKVRGKKLLNLATNKTTMNGWYSDNAEIVKYDNHEVLYYLYKIPVEKGKVGKLGEKYEKIGFVCATKINSDDVFKGVFRDIQVGSGLGKIREGHIYLHRED
jgi:hypothetical protein